MRTNLAVGFMALALVASAGASEASNLPHRPSVTRPEHLTQPAKFPPASHAAPLTATLCTGPSKPVFEHGERTHQCECDRGATGTIVRDIHGHRVLHCIPNGKH
jgi:hypothetical protein